MFKKHSFLKLSYKVILATILFNCTTLSANSTALDGSNEKIAFGTLGKWPKFEKLSQQGSFSSSFKSFKVQVSGIEKELVKWFNLSDEYSFKELIENVDEQDIKHVKYQQFYKDIPLSGKVIMVHSKKGKVLSINGQIGSDINLDIKPIISEDEAIDFAKKTFNLGDKSRVYKPKLVVYIKSSEDKGILAYEFRIDSFTPLFMKNIWVDAKTAEVLNSVSLIANADVNGTGATFYYGNQNIAVEHFEGGYRLRDNSRNIETYDGKNVVVDFDMINYEILFLDKEDIVSSTTHFSLNPAIDAHWGMEKTYDYYEDTFNRASFDGYNSKIRNFYDPGLDFVGSGSGFPNNAVAIPFPYNVMAFGTGDGINYNPVVGVDVAGHEFTHLVISNNGSGGLNYQGESGALNESFADIFGTSIEYYALGANSNWLIGEDIILYGSNHFMRDMQNPKITSYPNTYKGDYWIDTNSNYDYGGVHINSSVHNHWFYLLVEGGVGTNDLQNDYIVNGIGRQKAERISYHNMMNYLSSNAGFMDAYEGSLLIAEDFYGLNSMEYNEVKNAWYAVGIGEGGNLSIGNFDIKSTLNVYPNPVVDGIIKVNTNYVNPIAVEVYTLMGQRVLKDEVLQGENTIDVTSLVNGVYLMVFNVDGKTHTEKVILNQ